MHGNGYELLIYYIMYCKKKTFDNFQEATTKLTEIMSESIEKVKPIRVYKCIYCNKYHLTSKKISEYGRNVQRKIDGIRRRNLRRERSFIKRESEYWEKYFDVN
jgi:hypothetical protein